MSTTVCGDCGCHFEHEVHAVGCKNGPKVPNARFWIWHKDGPVKVTLKRGERLHFRRGGQTDEGYHYTWETYRHACDRVEHEIETQGRDCDGRLDTNSESTCELVYLQSDYNEYTGVMMPAWERKSASQRDYAAEAAGY